MVDTPHGDVEHLRKKRKIGQDPELRVLVVTTAGMKVAEAVRPEDAEGSAYM